MRWYLVVLLVVCLYMGQITAAPAEVAPQDTTAVGLLNARDNADATETATDKTASQTSTITTSTTGTAATATSASPTTSSASQTTQSGQTATDTSVPSLDSSSGSNSQSNSTSNYNPSKMTYNGGLPIQPSITPAVGVGGFILMAAGAALTFIGIRKPRIQIFLSTGLLAALGVAVLIEYVMSPPATDAVQGGYLVAIFATGAVFGGLALVFKEITEGLCCPLGGFCIGMWLLTIKAGGLVTENGAKIGFILAFAGGFYCLAFSHYTRAYGSMLCTAFGGATALVLGIDCFSRAGLKEFWLYVWGLNDDMFPLNTYTYPITRNIRVESAIIIIVTAFGVIFQMRLWKVIKERRAKEESIRKETQKQKDEAEAEVGRQLEENNLRERAEWEHIYGNGSDPKEPSMSETAVADDSRRGSESYGPFVHEKGNVVEMKEMASPDHSARVSDCGNNLEVVEEAAVETTEDPQNGQDLQEPEHSPHEDNHTDTKTMEEPAPVPKHLDLEANVSVDNDSEHGAVVGSEAAFLRSKRFSGRSFRNRLSWRSGHHGANLSIQSQSEEALIAVANSTSSVAGIADDLQSFASERPSLSSEVPENATQHEPKGMPKDNTDSERHETEYLDKNKSVDNCSETKTTVHAMIPGPDKEHQTAKAESVVHESHGPSMNAEIAPVDAKDGGIDEDATKRVQATEPEGQTDPVPLDPTQEQQEPNLNPAKNEELKTEEPTPENKPSVAPGNEQNAEKALACSLNYEANTDPEPVPQQEKTKVKPKLDVSTVQSIPEQTSRVVNSFRTREWAKHLADAEHPEFEAIQVENESEDATVPEETAAPVDIQGLLQTPLNAQPPPAVASSVPTSPDTPYHLSRGPLASPELSQSKARHSMQNISTAISPPISRNVSSASLSPPDQNDMAALRNSISTPYLNPNMVPKSQETVDSPRWSGPTPLLAVRENMMKNRMSSTSLRYDPWTASRSQSRQSLADPMGVVTPTLSTPEEQDEVAEENHKEDDIPLSKRRAMLQRQAMRSPSTNSTHSLERARSSTYLPVSTLAPADSGRSAAQMAAWRHSVREDLSKSRDSLAFTSQAPTSPERSRNTWGSVQQMRDTSSTQLDNAIADEMQRGNMTDLHRKAMRRMQASANRQL